MITLSLAIALLALALLVLPSSRSDRLHQVFPGVVHSHGTRRGAWAAALGSTRGKSTCVAVVAAGMTIAVGGAPHGVLVAVPIAGVAWLGARWFVTKRPKGRGDATSLRLAATGDLLAACLRAGLPVPTAVRAVAGTAPGAVADALRSTADLLALGAEPTEAWAPARRCAGTAELARAACRTARSGSALAQVAGDMAERARAGCADEAEAAAQRAGVLITGPLGLCFLPAFLCLGVVPVVIGLAGELTVAT